MFVNGTKKSQNPNGTILQHPLNPTIDPVTGIITPEEIDEIHGVEDERVDEEAVGGGMEGEETTLGKETGTISKKVGRVKIGMEVGIITRRSIRRLIGQM